MRYVLKSSGADGAALWWHECGLTSDRRAAISYESKLQAERARQHLQLIFDMPVQVEALPIIGESRH
jgi:hypothetical protein